MIFLAERPLRGASWGGRRPPQTPRPCAPEARVWAAGDEEGKEEKNKERKKGKGKGKGEKRERKKHYLLKPI